MKKFPSTVFAIVLTPTPKKLASILLIASAAAAQASIIANESFNYTTGALVGQATTGTGFTGSWSTSAAFPTNNSTTAFTVSATSLTMTGVASSAGKLSYSRSPNNTTAITQAFSSPLSATSTLYGSYLFQQTSDTGIGTGSSQGKTLGAVMVGNAAAGDNNPTFSWAVNGYNSTGVGAVEGPAIRSSSPVANTPVASPNPTLNLTLNTTYVMLFELNATTKTTTAWVLTEAQLTNFYGSLNSTTLNAATANTNAANGVFWQGSVTGTATSLGSMTNLTLLGLGSTIGSGFKFDLDEIRFSDTSLLESVTAVPEPSTIAIGLALGTFVIGRALRGRRNASKRPETA